MADLKEIVKQAKDAVEGLEEPLKSEGFKTILASLIEKDRGQKKVKEKKFQPNPKGSKDSDVEEICSKINRTKFQEVYALKKALDISLLILRISRDEAGIDGLLPLQISKILNLIFKIKVTQAAINMALGSAGGFVDRKPVTVQGGTGYKYFLMHAGEEYLNKIIKNGSNK